MALYIQVNGAKQVSDELSAIPESLAREVIRQMAAIAYDSAEAGARSHTKPGSTGALLQSLYNRQGEDRISRAVGHDPQRAPHALFVNLGTRPHLITPKNKKALRWASGGKFFFAQRVNHPGYIGDPYVYRAADDALAQFQTIVDQALKEIQP